MFDLTKITPVISHFKSVSKIFISSGSHFVMFCPYCNDAVRYENPTHGHLYISKTIPVFYCQRCGVAGTILSLLLDTDFNDTDTINYIKQFIKYNTTKSISLNIQRKKIDINSIILNKNISVSKKYPNETEMFKKYIYNRIGNVNFVKFLIYPDFINVFNQPVLACCFLNNDAEFVSARFIKKINNTIRFKNNLKTYYFFQQMNFEDIKDIVITEGIFDLINISLYSLKFKKPFYLSVNGKNFVSIIEQLIISELLIGRFKINIIFDNDTYYFKILKRIKYITSIYNKNIEVIGWKPFNKVNDVSEHPLITSI